MESSCIYCGCGCRLNYTVKNNKIIKISGVKSDEVSEGKPCVKGLTINEVWDKNRITTPTIKGEKTTLKKALEYAYNNTKELASNQVFFNTSGKITNENNFVMQKFARVCYKTPNIDSCCGRLCHIATVMGMQNVYGASNITKMKYVNDIDTLFIIGSEPDKDYPVFYNKLMKNKKVKILKIHSFVKGCNTRECVTTIKPGSETCLLNGLINELIRTGVKSKAEGFEILKETVKNYDADFITDICGLKKKEYKELVKSVINSQKFGIFHGMALTQHVNSLENVHSLLNLLLLKKGRVLTLRGEINVQGAGDLGGMPGVLPTGDLSTQEELEKNWGEISDAKGMNLIEALILHPVKAALLVEFDPFKSLPATKRVEKALKNTFVVYFGAYHNDTSRRADVVIPIASLIESEGSITNGERRIRKVNKVVRGEQELWDVLKEYSKLFKKEDKFEYINSKTVFKEIQKYVPSYSKINLNKLWKGEDQWADKKIKHERFMPEPFDGLDDATSEEYPYLLTTYRSKYSFLGDEITKNSKTLKNNRESIGFYFSKEDAKKLNIKNKTMVKVTSSAGELTSKAYVSEFLPPGIIGAYMHYSELKINTLYPVQFDEESFTPNYKGVAVRVEKV